MVYDNYPPYEGYEPYFNEFKHTIEHHMEYLLKGDYKDKYIRETDEFVDGFEDSIEDMIADLEKCNNTKDLKKMFDKYTYNIWGRTYHLNREEKRDPKYDYKLGGKLAGNLLLDAFELADENLDYKFDGNGNFYYYGDPKY